jgi:two-component system, OmpR family, KDP operon response regulator KdpE
MVRKITVLIVDMDERLSHFQHNLFVRQGWNGIQANPRENNPKQILDNPIILPDLCIINAEFPHIVNWLVSLRELKAPIIILAGMSGSKERTNYLNLGADVCLEQPPLCPDELVAQIKTLLRRNYVSETLSVQPFVVNYDDIGEFRFDFSARTVKINGTILCLTPVEYTLLRELVLNYERILPHTQIIRKIWGGG